MLISQPPDAPNPALDGATRRPAGGQRRRVLALLLLGGAAALSLTALPGPAAATSKTVTAPAKPAAKPAEPARPAEQPKAAEQKAPAGPTLQFGLFQKEGDAWWAWQTLQRRQPELVAALTPAVVMLDSKTQGGGVALRASAPTGTDGLALCRRVIGAGFGCLVTEAAPPPATRSAEAAPQPARPSEPATAAKPAAPPATAPAPVQVQAPVQAAATPPAPAGAAAVPPAAPAVAEAKPAGQTPVVTPLQQVASAPTLPLAVPVPPRGATGSPPPEGTVTYTDEDARTMADIEQKSRSKGRLRAVMPDSQIDVMPATLKRENWNLCALTFDDGPHRVHTRQVLEVLNREGVRATYFPVGKVAQNQGDLIRDFIAGGHEIGNHSLTHSDLRTANAETQRFEIAETNRILRGFGANPVLFRPPYGRYTADLLTIARDEQMQSVLWSIDTRDWQVRDADKIVQNIKAGAGTGNVLLMHSTYPSTVTALPRVIAELRAKGCEFVTLSEWLERARTVAAPKIVNAGMPAPASATPPAAARN